MERTPGKEVKGGTQWVDSQVPQSWADKHASWDWRSPMCKRASQDTRVLIPAATSFMNLSNKPFLFLFFEGEGSYSESWTPFLQNGSV